MDGEGLAQAMAAESRQEFELLIPQLPYVGGKQPFTQFVLSTGWFLAMYRALQRRGGTVEEAGMLAYRASQAYLASYPTFLGRFFGSMNFSLRHMEGLRKHAAESHQRAYPGDYVFDYVPGDGREFDYGVDYLECATVKFLRAQGAAELAPYLCAADKLYSDKLGWGLIRTNTLAEGANCCDFRFKRGGPTRVALPRALQED